MAPVGKIMALINWRKRVGNEEANRRTKLAASRGTWMHNVIEDLFNGEDIENHLEQREEWRPYFTAIEPFLELIDKPILAESAVAWWNDGENQGYSGTMTLLNNYAAAKRLNVSFVSIPDTAEVIKELAGATLLWIESPTNPGLEVADLPALIKAAKESGVTVAVDNTFATALSQQPLALGADITMNSVTKYLAGHSDVVLGSLSVQDPAIFKTLEDARKFNGSIPGPFEAWLALRGIRTFPLRFQKSCENALEIAKRLSAHPLVSRVRYPGLATDSEHEKAKAFMKSFGAIVSFEYAGDAASTDKVCQSSKIVTYATSLGGVESLWERRRRWPIESASVPETLIRLSVGCENVEDLWRDIDSALQAAK
jgi:cystathionine gamma-synthase